MERNECVRMYEVYNEDGQCTDVSGMQEHNLNERGRGPRGGVGWTSKCVERCMHSHESWWTRKAKVEADKFNVVAGCERDGFSFTDIEDWHAARR